LLLLLALSPPALAQQDSPAPTAARAPTVAPTVNGLTQRWEAIGNLFERSSAARHIEKEGSAESKEVLQQAKEMRTKAKQAIDAGELEKADTLLRDAAKLLFKAEKASRSPEMSAEKAKTDFIRRHESVVALLETGRRVAGEKSTNKPEFAQAEGLAKEADKLAAEGKYPEGRVKLDQAYVLITTAVRSLRGGDELTADKNFKTKADEYKYEQARNDDYQGLIAGVVEGKDASWTDVAKNSRTLRDEADGLAKKNDHEAALLKINESTGLLKGLLRRAGFPII
jgi:hypothetical protein